MTAPEGTAKLRINAGSAHTMAGFGGCGKGLAEAQRAAMISQRDRYAMLAMHKKRLEVERLLRYQTCECLRLAKMERAGS